jgi:IS30 family transposase
MTAAGRSVGAIAKALSRAKSTISRELRRNALESGCYSPLHAAGADQLRRWREAILEKDHKLRAVVCDRLAEGWTPEQIAGWLRAGHERGLRVLGSRPSMLLSIAPPARARNVKRVERIWRREGLKVPAKQPKRKRLWLNDGSCIRLRPEHPNHVWSYNFVEHRTHDGRKYRMLNIIDEFTRECLAIRINRKLNSTDVIDVLSDLFTLRGVPGHVRSDNGPEFIAKAVQDWIAAVGAKTAYIAPGSPRENGSGINRASWPRLFSLRLR